MHGAGCKKLNFAMCWYDQCRIVKVVHGDTAGLGRSAPISVGVDTTHTHCVLMFGSGKHENGLYSIRLVCIVAPRGQDASTHAPHHALFMYVHFWPPLALTTGRP